MARAAGFPGNDIPYYINSLGKANGTFIRLNATTRNADAANLDELELRKKRKYYDELPMAMSLASIAKSSLQNNFWCKVFFECL